MWNGPEFISTPVMNNGIPTKPTTLSVSRSKTDSGTTEKQAICAVYVCMSTIFSTVQVLLETGSR